MDEIKEKENIEDEKETFEVDKENLEEMGDSNSALNDIRNSEIELEERRAVAENEFYDGDK